ncbi:DUF427 domain-containing protein [Microbacterium pseudoresistens]|uniref:Uncharacterized protein (DUF427 family) n=1 Tax=Microbacterium pseudoresistens TaxID=640634 RepID=A0A7Y9JLP4_9MICO|nr:DUF427 domain-containing protein [Microbacterium pseudoresistens]NYD53932.1 uncharacterized protein (DUF427 family) [Microbacterium pseudoresistens]
MKAVLEGNVIAEADDAELIQIEGNHYFPPSSVHEGVLVESPTPYVCPWKGECQYFSVVVAGTTYKDLAWSYPEPYASGIERVGRDFSGYVAFGREIEVRP